MAMTTQQSTAPVNTLASLGLAAPEPSTIENELATVNTAEIAAQRPTEASVSFRNKLTDAERAAVKSAAPTVAAEMIGNFNYIIEFGSDVTRKVNEVNANLLVQQQSIKLPEADAVVNGILRAIDGYNAKYGNAKLQGGLDRLMEKLRGAGYTLKAMIRDSKPITDKLDMAEGSILEMEQKLQQNVTRGHELRKITLASIDEVVKVLAVFEEILDVTRAEAQQMQQALDAALNGDQTVHWKGDKFTVEQFRELQAQQVGALTEIEKSWFSWRQKFFLYTTNVAATRNIINSSFGLYRTCMRVRTDAIPGARSQLVVWQQAELARQGARMATEVNSGIDRLIGQAAAGTASAVAQVAEANQQTMLSEDTILKITNGLRDQFSAIVTAEKQGRAIRERNLSIIQQSEVALHTASREAQQELVANALRTVREATTDADGLVLDEIIR